MTLNSNDTLRDQVLSRENLNLAWKKARASKGAAGIDDVTIEQFVTQFKAVGQEIVESIRQGHYQPLPAKRVQTPKPEGGQRELGIFTVFDRVVQQALSQIVTPIFEPEFSEYSYGFRPKRSQHQAVAQLQRYVEEGKRIAVDVDLSKFFDRINHDFLLSLLGKQIKDKPLMKLIATYLRAGFVENGCWKASYQGVPQGSPLSPLLSNIVLNLLDKELERRQHKFVRDADDFVVVVSSKRAGDRVFASVTRFIERKLKLKINDEKSQVVSISRCKFLGFSFRGPNLVWHEKVFHQFKHEVRLLTGRSWGVSMKNRILELNQYLRGWINYFGIAQGYQKCIDLDGWIRRRLRMCY